MTYILKIEVVWGCMGLLYVFPLLLKLLLKETERLFLGGKHSKGHYWLVTIPYVYVTETGVGSFIVSVNFENFN